MITTHLVGWFPEIKYERSTLFSELLVMRAAVVVQYMPELSRGKKKVPPYVTRLVINGKDTSITNHKYSETLAEAEKAAAMLADMLNNA